MTGSSKLGRWAAAMVAVVMVGGADAALAAGKIRIAFGDIATVESLHFLIAIERAKEKGVEIETNFLKSEDIAAQAVVGGQADVGVGTPYALLQKVKAPIRMFFQMSALRFYPVVNTEFYQDWQDLDGEEIAVHARGSGTEAIMKLMADRHGITYSNISYVPGSEVRAGALLQGNIKASIVDTTNRRLLDQRAPGKFKVLEMEGVDATDEALYARADFLEQEAEAIDILVESLLVTWREIDQNPASIVELREKYGLLSDLPQDLEADIPVYFEEAAAQNSFPMNGGDEEAAKTDFEFYALAGQLEGDPDTLRVEDFWDFGPLERVLARLGRV